LWELHKGKDHEDPHEKNKKGAASKEGRRKQLMPNEASTGMARDTKRRLVSTGGGGEGEKST